ncbi:MAG: acyltransferase family protein [Clostridia bacterium]|nr:acyltransferase family protein [Clostridia bacterium]
MKDGLTRSGAVRNPSVDLLKVIAFFLVVTVHFTAQIGIRDEIHVGRAMFALDVLYAFGNTCVALFLMATGWVMTNKKLSGKYYKGLIRISVIYVLCSIFCTACKVIFYAYPNTVSMYIKQILHFEGSDYAWYVEMYVCLFLLIPFLNAAYHALDTRKKKTVLILTMLVLTAIPGVLNTFNLSDPSWWASPVSSNQFSKIFPTFFTSMYPVTYFFIGSYLREFPPKIKKIWLFLMWIGFGLFGGAYNFWRFHGGKFFWGEFMTNPSLFVVLIAVPFFALITSLDLTRLPAWIKKALSLLSRWTYGAFLVAAIVDMRFYPHFNEWFGSIPKRLLAEPIAVLTVALISLAISAVIDTLYVLAESGIAKLAGRLNKNAEAPAEK